jgi:hypothetical protein
MRARTEFGCLALLAAAALLAGCGDARQAPVHEASSGGLTASQTRYTERRELAQPGRTPLEVGEDCTAAGQDGCRSGLCLHARGGLHYGYYCSERCTASESCPVGWGCSQIFPSSPSGVCVPPKGWVARAARAR